ncbi:hypothetical protein [Parendozoicomonas sp. Alg238-R29]|uniref:hypothetical protein n=1 Tax=Parendozoicomonas sp. Alg238-R29 TaxID=2993446 RepID=UPI00248EA5DB|nr:hypothetical protein [Parendozoicomonas sp. Alg238-R29]
MESLKTLQEIAGTADPMFGAALITEDGSELPITTEMIDECINQIVCSDDSPLYH